MYFIKILKKYLIKKWENNIFPHLNLHYHKYNKHKGLKNKENIHNPTFAGIYNSIVYKICQEKIKCNT
jgi:hypothetical protein